MAHFGGLTRGFLVGKRAWHEQRRRQIDVSVDVVSVLDLIIDAEGLLSDIQLVMHWVVVMVMATTTRRGRGPGSDQSATGVDPGVNCEFS